MKTTKQISEREFEIRRGVTGTDVLKDKLLRANMMRNPECDRIIGADGPMKEYKSKGLFPCWVLPVIAYPERGEGLGETITFGKVTLKVPKDILDVYGGRKDEDVFLVLQNDFDTDADLTIRNAKVTAVHALPGKDGWRLVDKETGIPLGHESSPNNPEARYGRFSDSAYIGPVVRGVSGYYYGRRDVGLDLRLDHALSVGWSSQAKGEPKEDARLGLGETARATAFELAGSGNVGPAMDLVLLAGRAERRGIVERMLAMKRKQT